MKKIFTFFALLSLFVASCTEVEEKTPELQLDSSSTLTFDENGGELRIFYKVTNAEDQPEVTLSEDADWFSAQIEEYGVILVNALENVTMEERSADLTISYLDQQVAVTVIQIAPEIEALELTMIVGQYNGNKYSTVPNYYFAISNNEYSAYGDPLANSIYYMIDLYSEVVPEDVKNIKVPVGTYTLSVEDSEASGTFSRRYSYYLKTGDVATMDDAVLFSDATLTVTEDEMILNAITEDGERHKVVFKGDYTIENKSGQGEGVLSDLTDDYSPDVANNFAICEYYGNFYQCGNGNWMIILRSEGDGDEIQLDFVAEGLDFDAGFAGNYVCRTDFSPFSLTPGLPEGSGYIGCWYFEQIGGKLSGMKAPFTAGSTMVATDNGDGTYTLKVEAYDDTPERHKITFEWTGLIEAEDWSSMFQSPANPASRFGKRPFRVVE